MLSKTWVWSQLYFKSKELHDFEYSSTIIKANCGSQNKRVLRFCFT